MTPPAPPTLEEMKSMLEASRLTLVIGYALLSELAPNAESRRMAATIIATGNEIEKRLIDSDETMHRAMCIAVSDTIEKLRQLILRLPYPNALKEGRQGWLEGSKRLIRELESVKGISSESRGW